MKNKLIYANFDKETGESKVIIDTKYGWFTGYAQCHPEEEAVSEYAGCRYAESRANIQVFQYKKSLINANIKELENFEKSLKSMKGYNHHSLEARRLRRRIHELKGERDALKEQISKMKIGLKNSMDARDAYLKKQKAE